MSFYYRKIRYRLVRRLIGFVICCDTVTQQKHRRQRQQGHHGNHVRNERHFLILWKKFIKIR